MRSWLSFTCVLVACSSPPPSSSVGQAEAELLRGPSRASSLEQLRSRIRSVSTRRPPPIPIIRSLSVSPTHFTVSSTVVQLSYAIDGATSTSLTIAGAPAAGFSGATSGTHSFTATTSVEVELEARGRLGVSRRTAEVRRVELEREPNDTFAQANALSPFRDLAVVRGVTARFDRDRFSLQVPAGHSLEVFVTRGDLTTCVTPQDGITSSIWRSGERVALASATSCARISPQTHPEVRSLAAASYVFSVESNNSTTYYLHVRTHAPACGNGFVELAEQCDDGNASPGDGCAATCGFEAEHSVVLPLAQPLTLAGAIAPSTDRDAIHLTVTSPSYLAAEIFVDAQLRSCPLPTATELRLYPPVGTPLGIDTTDGVSNCSRLSPGEDPFMRLEPGEYWLVVESSRNASEVPRYDLVLETIPMDVCGNGVTEPSRGELCDGEPYCDTGCQVPLLATVQGPDGGVTIEPFEDVEYVLLEVTAPAVLATATTDPYEMIDLELLNLGTRERAQHQGIVTGAPLAPGRYLLRVDVTDVIANFWGASLMHFHVGHTSGCGNGVIQAPETCDDFNTADGDGCSATCEVERGRTFTTSGGASGVITPRFAFREYDLVLTQASVVGADISGNEWDCGGISHGVSLHDANGALLSVGSNFFTYGCDELAEELLPAGAYTLRVTGPANGYFDFGLSVSIEALAAAVLDTYAVDGFPIRFSGSALGSELPIYAVTVASGPWWFGADTDWWSDDPYRGFLYDSAGTLILPDEDSVDYHYYLLQDGTYYFGFRVPQEDVGVAEPYEIQLTSSTSPPP